MEHKSQHHYYDAQPLNCCSLIISIEAVTFYAVMRMRMDGIPSGWEINEHEHVCNALVE